MLATMLPSHAYLRNPAFNSLHQLLLLCRTHNILVQLETCMALGVGVYKDSFWRRMHTAYVRAA